MYRFLIAYLLVCILLFSLPHVFAVLVAAGIAFGMVALLWSALRERSGLKRAKAGRK